MAVKGLFKGWFEPRILGTSYDLFKSRRVPLERAPIPTPFGVFCGKIEFQLKSWRGGWAQKQIQAVWFRVLRGVNNTRNSFKGHSEGQKTF